MWRECEGDCGEDVEEEVVVAVVVVAVVDVSEGFVSVIGKLVKNCSWNVLCCGVEKNVGSRANIEESEHSSM